MIGETSFDKGNVALMCDQPCGRATESVFRVRVPDIVYFSTLTIHLFNYCLLISNMVIEYCWVSWLCVIFNTQG